MGYAPIDFRTFVRESNRIEGIHREPTAGELREHAELIGCPDLTVGIIERFVGVIAPGKPLRREPTMNVRVGNHLPPRGGPEIESGLAEILAYANARVDPWVTHCAYETLHPFMDGNGRSGRAIWLWQMINQNGSEWPLVAGFLHGFYYQTLARSPHRLQPDAGA